MYSIDVDCPHWRWFYSVPPESKSLEQCRSHGADHASYAWSPRIDPRWSVEQKSAYVEGWNSIKQSQNET